MTITKEAILEHTVEHWNMTKALGSLRPDPLPSQPRTFAILAEAPLEEIRRLQLEIEQLSANLATKSAAA
jgi:hypothetical protein